MKLSPVYRYSAALILCASLLVSVSCSNSKSISTLEEDDLFTIKYGNFEDELNLFNLSAVGTINTNITMRDGFFYIANGESKKILELNSYGDLLSLYYNADTNRTPSFAQAGSTASSTQKAVVYPFNKLGSIVVDSKKYLYVVDTLPAERQEQDTEQRLLLSQVVLRFAPDGTFIDYLGQQGPGGTPFPFIRKIYTTKDNELVVVCTTNNGPTVYWFSSEGYLQYTIPITNESVPDPFKKDQGNDHFISVENAVPDYDSKVLYIKADYFTGSVDDTSHAESGVDYAGTFIYPFSIADEKYASALEIPPYENTVADGFSKTIYKMPFDLLGVSRNGWAFFIIADDTGYLLQMVELNGQKILKRHLKVDPENMLYYSLSLSEDGIISGIFAGSDKAHMVWWRADSLIAALLKK